MVDRWLSEVIARCQIICSPLRRAETSELIRSIIERYTTDYTDRFLWEHFIGDVSVRTPNASTLATQYPQVPVIILYESENKFHGYLFHKKEQLLQMIAEAPSFEFYLTDPAVSYVICRNHHNYLIGVGSCVSWVSSLPEEID
jgi:hypothetical protein